MKSVSRNQSGQAIVEYILVLLVVVSILLGVMWQFNDGFRKFTTSYFGDYLACLLELGELPALGGTASGECNYESFALGDSPESGVGGGGDGSGSDDDKSGDSDRSSSSGDSASSDSSGSGGGGSRAAESSGRFGSNYSGSSQSGRPAAVVIGTAKDDTYTGSTEASNARVSKISGRSSSTIQLVDQSGGVIDPFENRKVKSAPVAIAKDSRGDVAKAKKQRVDIVRKTASKDIKDEDSKIGFGDFLRWLLIAAIIIAIVFFLGGQALQIGKSWE